MYSNQSCFICLLELRRELCTIRAPKAQSLSPKIGPNCRYMIISATSFHWFLRIWVSDAQLLGHFGPKIGLWSFSQNLSTGFASVLVYVSNRVSFRGVLNISLRCPKSGSFWAPKYIIIQVFNHFLKNVPLVSHNFCFTCSLGVFWVYFSECAKGPISGPKVKVCSRDG